jgi:hypothetical protein
MNLLEQAISSDDGPSRRQAHPDRPLASDPTTSPTTWLPEDLVDQIAKASAPRTIGEWLQTEVRFLA